MAPCQEAGGGEGGIVKLVREILNHNYIDTEFYSEGPIVAQTIIGLFLRLRVTVLIVQ